ncbi:MAG: hypothetical protein Q8R45_11375 [Brevundimonas sp.]|uniref:hypothetical protein n=1 Tax=Brevundimonas sp. TaxID=1871086 RepID=UPI0027329548|nr:hypothetical protein [Brevundimonas sp.]MDP3369653.1 hypothetical protein [Brevundimonas sp.]MDP3657553.1 hypothetical protein [Brevundimonas sp.]
MRIGRRWIGAGLAVALFFGATTVTSAAADEAVNTPAARGVTQILTAAELAAWGRDRGDAGALIMAARLLAEVPLRQTEGDSDGETPFLTATSLLDEAAAMAGDNVGVIDAIERLRDPLTRGVRSSTFGTGPVLTVKSLQARERWAFDVEARGGEILRVAAIGDGDTNIDLIVRDANGAVVCRDGFGDHYPVCTVSPRAGGQMRVDIVNRGDVWTKVQVLSN